LPVFSALPGWQADQPGFGNCQGWGERASARRSPALSIVQSETGAPPGSRHLYSFFVTKVA